MHIFMGAINRYSINLNYPIQYTFNLFGKMAIYRLSLAFHSKEFSLWLRKLARIRELFASIFATGV